MHPAIQTRIEQKRGCGWRRPGGIYLIASGIAVPCGKMPIKLEICPTCGAGFHFSRSPYWINGTALLKDTKCDAGASYCSNCPLNQDPGRVLLMWIGEEFYPTPKDWLDEADRMGVSRRIKAIPQGFEVGKTWVWVAHNKGFQHPDGSFSPAVFRAFKPTAVEYVVKGTETDSEIDALIERGIQPVKVERAGEIRALFENADIKHDALQKELNKLARSLNVKNKDKMEALKVQVTTLQKAVRHEADPEKRKNLLAKLRLIKAKLR